MAYLMCFYVFRVANGWWRWLIHTAALCWSSFWAYSNWSASFGFMVRAELDGREKRKVIHNSSICRHRRFLSGFRIHHRTQGNILLAFLLALLVTIDNDSGVFLFGRNHGTATIFWSRFSNRICCRRLEFIGHRTHSIADLVHVCVRTKHLNGVAAQCTAANVQTKRKMGTTQSTETQRMAEIQGRGQTKISTGRTECQPFVPSEEIVYCIWQILRRPWLFRYYQLS